jgi:hypothetical protein
VVVVLALVVIVFLFVRFAAQSSQRRAKLELPTTAHAFTKQASRAQPVVPSSLVILLSLKVRMDEIGCVAAWHSASIGTPTETVVAYDEQPCGLCWVKLLVSVCDRFLQLDNELHHCAVQDNLLLLRTACPCDGDAIVSERAERVEPTDVHL